MTAGMTAPALASLVEALAVYRRIASAYAATAVPLVPLAGAKPRTKRVPLGYYMVSALGRTRDRDTQVSVHLVLLHSRSRGARPRA
jgi:hypothetical protein